MLPILMTCLIVILLSQNKCLPRSLFFFFYIIVPKIVMEDMDNNNQFSHYEKLLLNVVYLNLHLKSKSFTVMRHVCPSCYQKVFRYKIFYCHFHYTYVTSHLIKPNFDTNCWNIFMYRTTSSLSRSLVVHVCRLGFSSNTTHKISYPLSIKDNHKL